MDFENMGIMEWALIAVAGFVGYKYLTKDDTAVSVIAPSSSNSVVTTGVQSSPANVVSTVNPVTATQVAQVTPVVATPVIPVPVPTAVVATVQTAGTYPSGANGESLIDHYGTYDPKNGVGYADAAFAAYDPNFAARAGGAILLGSTWNNLRQVYGQQHNDPNVKLATGNLNQLLTITQYHGILKQQGLEGIIGLGRIFSIGMIVNEQPGLARKVFTSL